jgi:hypothetical protein
MKKCSKCSEIKELTEFFSDKQRPDGKASQCKTCKTASTMQWRDKNKDYYNKTMRAFHKKHYEKQRLNRYDLTVEQYQSLLEAQGHKCAIEGCNKKGTKKRKLAIDHDHKTGKVRGILCYKHNRDMNAIDTELVKLLEYKKKHEETKV